MPKNDTPDLDALGINPSDIADAYAAGNSDVVPPHSAGGFPTADLEPYTYSTDADTDEFKRSFAANLTLRKCRPKTLFAMAIGMPEFQGILDRPPLSVLKRKEMTDAYIPKAGDFKHEIKRRAHFFMTVDDEAAYFTDTLKRAHPLKTKRSSIVLPQPNQWLNSSLKEWLLSRPMKPSDNDMAFLREQIHRVLEYLNQENTAEGLEVAKLPDPAAAVANASGMEATTPVAGPAAPEVEEIITDGFGYTSSADTDEFKRCCADTFLQRDAKPRILLAMATGMVEYQGILDRAPFSVLKRRDLTEDYIPRAEDYRFEIKRRAHFFMNIEEEAQYYTRDSKRKNPLENMRGIVALPQPNQWKLQQLKEWLEQRPLKPNPKDTAFLKDSIKKFEDALTALMEQEPQIAMTPAQASQKKVARGSVSKHFSFAAANEREQMLMDVVEKQESILTAVAKQTQQQNIFNKIAVLNQAISGYQSEISVVRNTINDAENRILQVDMRIAEAPDAANRLRELLVKPQEAKQEAEAQLKEFQQLVEEANAKIAAHNKEMEELAAAVEDATGEPIAKRQKVVSDALESAGVCV